MTFNPKMLTAAKQDWETPQPLFADAPPPQPEAMGQKGE